MRNSLFRGDIELAGGCLSLVFFGLIAKLIHGSVEWWQLSIAFVWGVTLVLAIRAIQKNNGRYKRH
jgi:hypothetical protein